MHFLATSISDIQYIKYLMVLHPMYHLYIPHTTDSIQYKLISLFSILLYKCNCSLIVFIV